MSHNYLFNANFHLLLSTIDQDLSKKIQQKGCSNCGNKLHQSDYPRSPVGLPAEYRQHYDERISFCCVTCRKRTTPTSVRFFGRRWYPAPLLLLISVLMVGINDRRLEQVRRHFGITVSESTWKRWRRWWRESFMQTKFWQKEKSLVALTIDANKLIPRALLDLLEGNIEEKLCRLLQFLSPLTGGALRAV